MLRRSLGCRSGFALTSKFCFECLRGFVSGLYAGNYDISHVYVDNLCKITRDNSVNETEKFLNWLERFSEKNMVKFTVTLSADADTATDGMRHYL